MNEQILGAVVDGDVYGIEELVQKSLEAGEAPGEVLKTMMAGLERCGQKFESGEYFLPEMMMSADAFKLGMQVLSPRLAATPPQHAGTVVLGTVQGDVHDIGKNLVRFMLEGAGFEVIDLGVDVPATRFADAVAEHKPHVLGMSALLTTTMLGMGEVIEELQRRGLRDKVKVLIGGSPVSKRFAEQIGADAYGTDAGQAVGLVRGLM